MTTSPVSFGEWVKVRRNLLGLSRRALAQQVACSPDTIKKIEGDLRRPSLQIAELLAEHLLIPTEAQDRFIRRARGQYVPDLPAPEDLPRTDEPAEARRHNLPAATTPFVGREAELAALHQLLADPQNRLVTILGPGGMGKTRLGLEAGRQMVEAFSEGEDDQFGDGVYFVELAPLQAVEHIVPAIAEAIHYTFHTSAPPQEQLVQFLRRKKLLLILDNFEHLLEGGEIVRSILTASENVTILTTSRTRLSLKGEQLFQIGGMPYPAETEAGRALTYSAVQLFLQNARRVQPGLTLEPADLETLRRICQLTEGMPLAILLASSWLEMLSLPEIVAEIEGSFDFLESNWQDVPDRHQSIRAVFDHSWRLLSDKEQRLFAALSVFRGGFTRQAVQEVTGATLRDLLGLVNKSLVQREPGNRYGLHELLRQYGIEHLAQNPSEYQQVRHKHCDFFCEHIKKHVNLFGWDGRDSLFETVSPDLRNIQLAWNWALEHRLYRRLYQAITGCYWIFGTFGGAAEAEFAFRPAAKHVFDTHATVPPENIDLYIRILAYYSWFATSMGDFSVAKRHLTLGEALLKRGEKLGLEFRRTKLYLLDSLSWHAGYLGLKEEKHYAQQMLPLARELDVHEDVLNAQIRLIGHIEDKEEALKQLAGLLIEPDVPSWHLNLILEMMASTSWQLGRLDDAVKYSEQLLTLGRKEKSQTSIAHSTFLLGWEQLLMGEFRQARQTLSGTDVRTEELADESPLIVVSIHSTLAQAELHLGSSDQARQQIAEAQDYSLERNFIAGLAIAQYCWGLAYLSAREYELAEENLQNAMATPQFEVHSSFEQSVAILGGVQQKRRESELARKTFTNALQRALKPRDFPTILHALPFIALYLHDQGQPELALEIYALAMTYPFVANSQWYAKLVGEEMEAAAAALPVEAAAAARERGQKRDIWATAAELLAILQEQG